jgi:CBS domain-containing protein
MVRIDTERVVISYSCQLVAIDGSIINRTASIVARRNAHCTSTIIGKSRFNFTREIKEGMMTVREIMTENPASCTPDTGLQEVAKMFLDHDCGCIPVVENGKSMRPVGVITDRDIVCRVVAKGQNPLDMTAGDCMSGNVVVLTPEMSLDDCCKIMEENQVRRVPVVDAGGRCCGMVSQADIAKNAPKQTTAEVVKEVSKNTGQASKHSA